MQCWLREAPCTAEGPKTTRRMNPWLGAWRGGIPLLNGSCRGMAPTLLANDWERESGAMTAKLQRATYIAAGPMMPNPCRWNVWERLQTSWDKAEISGTPRWWVTEWGLRQWGWKGLSTEPVTPHPCRKDNYYQMIFFPEDFSVSAEIYVYRQLLIKLKSCQSLLIS